MIISIHQPAFMPWYPFFKKIEQADLFIIQQNCQFERRGYQNRFNINGNWYTMSVKKAKVNIPICKVQYNNPFDDWKKIKRQLPLYKDKLECFDHFISDSLALTNKSIITSICNQLDIKTKIIEDYETPLLSNDRLIKLCKDNNADTYLAGLGSKSYMNLNLFSKNGIKVIFQDKLERKPILEML